MKYFLILKNDKPEKLIHSLDENTTKKQDISFWLMTHQILNIFDDAELANQVMSSMIAADEANNADYKIVELHQIDVDKGWN